MIELKAKIKTTKRLWNFIFQWNKRDLPNISLIEDMQKILNKENYPAFSATAIQGEGVFETLETITELVLNNIKQGLNFKQGVV